MKLRLALALWASLVALALASAHPVVGADAPSACQKREPLPSLLRHPRVPSVTLGYVHPVGLELSKCYLRASR